MPPKMPPTAIFTAPAAGTSMQGTASSAAPSQPPASAAGTTACNPVVIDDDDDVVMGDEQENPQARPTVPSTNLSKKWMTTPAALVVADPSLTELGDGAYKRIVKRYIVQRTRADFFKTSYPRMQPSKDPEINPFYEDQAKQFPVLRESMTVETTDGTRLVAFFKNGMTIGRSDEEYARLKKQSEDAAAELIRLDPNKPKADGRVEAVEEKRRRLALQGLKLIRKHFSYIIPTGYPYGPAVIHSEAKRSSKSAQAEFDACVRYMRDTTWEHEQISRLIKAVDTEDFHQEAAARYQSLQHELEHLYQGPEGIHLGLSFLVNAASNPHRDDGDMPTAWTTTNTWGEYTGGHLVLPELGLRIDQQPGDVTIMHARVLIHMITAIDGNRICNVRYSNENVTRPLPAPLELRLVCPFEGCSVVKKSESSFLTHLRGPSGKENAKARERGSTAYHFVPSKEAHSMLKDALTAYEASK
ncbi:MAG: hypothetical protein Q9211_001048, partial [Gyalolechia sp. 1 TL-2023]